MRQEIEMLRKTAVEILESGRLDCVAVTPKTVLKLTATKYVTPICPHCKGVCQSIKVSPDE